MSYDTAPLAETYLEDTTQIALAGVGTIMRQETAQRSEGLVELSPITQEEFEEMRAIAAFVRQRGGDPNTWDITKHHDHFFVGDNEVLLETNDPTDKTLLSRVVSRDSVESTTAVATTFRLGDLPESIDQAHMHRGCESICVESAWDGRHHPGHRG